MHHSPQRKGNSLELKELEKIVAKGEDRHHQFKEDASNGDKLAAEMVAFSAAS